MSKDNIKGLALESILWLSLKRITSQVILTVSNLILVRLLFPEQFGSFAIIHFIVSLLWVFADLGLGRALIQQGKEPDKELLRTVWWTQTGLAFLISFLIWFLAPLVVSYYSNQLNPQAVWWLRLFTLAHIFYNMNLVTTSLLERHLVYKKVLVGEVLGLFITQAATIIFASLRFGVESFILGNVLGKFFTLIIYFRLSPWPWGFSWDFQKLKTLFSFGVPFQMSTWFGFLNSAVIHLFIGKFPGPGGFSGPYAVGIIIWAAGVASLPLFISSILEQMIFPLMSRLQKDIHLAQAIFTKAFRFIAITTFGGCSMLFVLAPEIIKIVYTPSWFDGLISLRLGAIQSILIGISGLAMLALLAFGEAKFYRNMHVLWLVLQWILTVPLVLMFGFWGVNLAGVIVSLTSIFALYKLQEYFKISYLELTFPPLVSGIAAGIAVFLLKQYIPVHSLFSLTFITLIGSVLYLILIFKLSEKQLKGDLKAVFGVIHEGVFHGRFSLNYLLRKER